MKFMTKAFIVLSLLSLSISSCRKETKQTPQVAQDEVSQAVKDKIYSLGFTASTARKVDEGYLVEGDIILTEEQLNSVPENIFLRIADEEQYRTNNLVTGLPR